MQPGYLLNLGETSYTEAWDLQRSLAAAVSQGAIPDTIVLLEHAPVVTLGRRTDAGEVHVPEGAEVEIVETDRGGKSTYHGPGQLVGYPILALGERYDVISYLRRLEDVLIRVAGSLGVEAHRDDDHTGVWVGRNKIGAIGVKITRGISMHGFAFNVATDLSMFEGIVPCGIRDRWVTSVAAETGRIYSLKEVATLAAVHLAEVFERTLVWTHPRSLHGTGHTVAGAL